MAARTITAERVKAIARQAGFELAGIAPAVPVPESGFYRQWVASGMAGEMGYLTGHRGDLREDPRNLLPAARSILCAGKLYNGPEPYSTRWEPGELGWISRYAWGDDYHTILRAGLEKVAAAISQEVGSGFEYRVCVDTAPLLERALARRAGLGWIGRNTCLIHEGMGSWFFLGELLLSLDLHPDSPPPDRCGTCTRCIDACPTHAIVPASAGGGPEWQIDSRLCISYLTIELRGEIPESVRGRMGAHIFGCDICQDVCPWNRRAPVTDEPSLRAVHATPPLARMATLSEDEFRAMFRGTPVTRAKYRGFLRNVAVAMGNSGKSEFREPLERLAAHPDQLVAEHARRALAQLY